MIYIGIDVGVTGGYAILDNDGVPIKTEIFSGWNHIGKVFQDFAERIDVLVALEAVSAMRGQGVSSMFTFGANYGGWLSLLETKFIPYILVRPQKWQKAILGSFPKGQSKLRAYDYVRRKYPTMELKQTRDSGVIDALCIAEYARKDHLGFIHPV
jgi:hypothetical protein